MGVQDMAGEEMVAYTRRTAFPRVLVWCFALVPFLVLFLTRAPDAYRPDSGDYAQYLSHGRAVAEGRQYTDIGYVYTTFAARTGPEAFPPGVPVLLAAAFRIFGSTERIAELMLFPFALAFLLLGGLYFARTSSLQLGIAATIVTGLSPNFVHSATTVTSDIPFCALVWGVLLLAERDGTTWSWRRVAMVSLVGACAILVRSAGIALVPAIVVYTALHYRRIGVRPLVAAVVWLMVYLSANAILPIGSAYGDVFPNTISGILRAIASNAVAYRFSVMDGLLYPFASSTANVVYHLIGFALVVAGAVEWLRTRWASFLTAFTITYVGILAVFPAANIRYAWPLYPLLAWCLLRGVLIVVRQSSLRLSPSSEWRVTAVATVGLVGAALASEGRRAPGEDFATTPEVQTLFARVRQELAPSRARVGFGNARVLTWKTRVAAMQLFRAPPDSILAEFRRKEISHVIIGVDDFATASEDSVRVLVAERPSNFRLLFATTGFEVYRLEPASGDNARVRSVAPLANDPRRMSVAQRE